MWVRDPSWDAHYAHPVHRDFAIHLDGGPISSVVIFIGSVLLLMMMIMGIVTGCLVVGRALFGSDCFPSKQGSAPRSVEPEAKSSSI